MRPLLGRRNQERAKALVSAGIITEERSCRGKIRHPDKNSAIYAAKRSAQRKDRKADYYKCGFCGGYHVTMLRHGEDEE